MPRFPIGAPPPPLEVLVVLRRPVEVPPGPPNQARNLVREVLVLRLEGPVGEDLPEDLVGLAAPDLSGVAEEHEVHLCLPVELEDHEDSLPLQEGLLVHPSLEEHPPNCEALPDEPEVLELVEGEVAVVDELEVPEGGVLLARRGASRRPLSTSRVLRRRWPLAPPVHTRSSKGACSGRTARCRRCRHCDRSRDNAGREGTLGNSRNHTARTWHDLFLLWAYGLTR